MAISRVGSSAALANNVALFTHQPGDLIVIYAHYNVTGVITPPAGWTMLSTNASSGSTAWIGAKIAKSASEVSGNWINANAIHAVGYRSSNGCLWIPNITGSLVNSATITYPANSQYGGTESDLWYVATMFNASSTNASEVAPTGMTNINNLTGATFKTAIYDTNGSFLANWTQRTVSVATSAIYRTSVIAIYEMPANGGGGGGGLLLPRSMNGGYSA
jgi:hypothetical protein